MALTTLMTPLIQKINGVKRKLLPETVASQVFMADGTSVEVKISTLARAVSGQTVTYVVADIAARDALTDLHVGDQAWVKDASADDTVDAGAAKYIYEGDVDDEGVITNGKWVKTAEAESMDMVFKWADLQDKPTSTVEDIDAAVAATKTLKDRELTVDETTGDLMLDGKVVGGKYAGFVNVTPEDEGFDDAVAALNLQEGAIFTVVKETTPESPEVTEP